MSEPQGDNFDDPALKAAVRRAWGAERCPPALRERVVALSSGSPSSLRIGKTRSGALGRFVFYGWLAAGVMLVAAGLVFRFHRPAVTNKGDVSLGVPLPTTLADELIVRHDECCSAKDHHMPGLSRDDFPKIASELHQKLGFPVLAANLPGSWNFHGASVCWVGSTESGHLVFGDSHDEYVSIFSLPRQFLPATIPGREFSEILDHHPIAGFATPDGFYCIVGSSKSDTLSLDQVRSFRDGLKTDIARASDPSERVTIAEAR